MNKNKLTPLDALEIGVTVSGIFWSNWQQILADHQKRREAELQQALLAPKGRIDDERLLPRINRISAATRAFFDQNQAMTFWSFIPAVRDGELRMARSFVHAFQQVDHDLRIEAGVPLAEWRRDRSFRDELGKVVGHNDDAYHTVSWLPIVPQKMRGPAIQQLCGELKREHDSHQRQME